MKYSAHNVVYQLGKAENIPGKNYDAVFSNSVLHWCEDKDKVFKQVARSLKEGGKFGFVTPADFSIAENFCTPVDMLTPECRQNMINRARVPTSDQLLQLASDNGFASLIVTEHVRDWIFDGASKLIEFFMTHFHEVNGRHFNIDKMKQHFGDGEIVFKMSYVTTVLLK